MIPLRVVEAHAAPVANGRRIGRYALFGEIASGGMATVYFGRLVGAVGFSRAVAVKQLHPQYAKSPEFVAQFLDEAQLTARVRHPNVVSVLDVVARDGELFVIMEFVEGEPLSRLVRLSRDPIPLPVASAILVQVLLGLHAAHEATTENGERLEIVHRDVSPQNMLVGVDGASHILDFGVAKAASRVHTTENGQIKGKLTYMAPEQLRGEDIDRRVDVFAAGIVLWELLACQRLFARGDPGATVTAVLSGAVPPPSLHRPDVSPELDALVLKALAPKREGRFESARAMAVALEACVPPASSLRVGAWVESVAGESLKLRSLRLREAEESTGVNAIVDAAGLQRQLSQSGPHLLPVQDLPVTATANANARQGAPPDSSWLRKSAAVWLLRLAALLLGVTGAWLLWLGFGRAHASSPEPELGTTAQAVSSPIRVSAPDRAPESAPVVPTTDLPAVASPTVAPRATAAPHVSKKVSAKTAAAWARCNPPYVLDAQGRKRFKAECF